MSEQADIEAALARATAAYKNVRAERDALKDATDRAAAAEAERDRLREALEKAQGGVTDYAKQYVALRTENDRLREALKKIAEANRLDDPHEAQRIARAALAKEV